jgi:hypothetical protein
MKTSLVVAQNSSLSVESAASFAKCLAAIYKAASLCIVEKRAIEGLFRLYMFIISFQGQQYKDHFLTDPQEIAQ